MNPDVQHIQPPRGTGGRMFQELREFSLFVGIRVGPLKFGQLG